MSKFYMVYISIPNDNNASAVFSEVLINSIPLDSLFIYTGSDFNVNDYSPLRKYLHCQNTVSDPLTSNCLILYVPEGTIMDFNLGSISTTVVKVGENILKNIDFQKYNIPVFENITIIDS